VLRRHQTEIRHELAGIAKPSDISEFGHQCSRGHQTHAAQRLQRFDNERERPLRQRRFDMGLQPVAPRRRRLDGLDAELEWLSPITIRKRLTPPALARLLPAWSATAE
jgi:hypothetical protein